MVKPTLGVQQLLSADATMRQGDGIRRVAGGVKDLQRFFFCGILFLKRCHYGEKELSN